MLRLLMGVSFVCIVTYGKTTVAQEAVVVVAEGEQFKCADDRGWRVRHQDESYATQAFGGMWVTHGGLLGADADSVDSVAVQRVTIPSDGVYRVWSKYQAPPYFHYCHTIEIRQGGKTVFSHTYGKMEAERIYSFFGKTTYGLPPKKQVWFPWGVDHDAAEAPRKTVRLSKGPAEIRLTTVQNPKPGGARFVDFVLLTTNHEDTCIGWEKHGQAKSPFIFEAIRSTPIAMRFKNVLSKPARIKLFTHFGHFTWHCGPKRGTFPEQEVLPGKWSPWFNINQVVELITDEGLQVTLVESDTADQRSVHAPSVTVPIEFARQMSGGDSLGKMSIRNAETVHFPVDIVWNRTKRLELSSAIAERLVNESKRNWRRAVDHKPRYIAFYGSFSRSDQPWAIRLKDALGYNTLLPDPYEQLTVDGYFQHLRNADQIRKYAEMLGDKRSRFRVCSFGDEISLGGINFADPQYVEPFRAWLRRRGVTRDDIGMDPAQAVLNGNKRLNWYSQLFSAEQRFAHYRQLTDVARKAFGPQVLTGANYSPHHDVMYYGNQLQWVDAFKHRAMSMFWTEDYLFFVPELPQTISFMFARMHCAVKYNGQPIHMYVMPHAPGQPADVFRRNTLYSIGAGARHIDNFWVAPQENYSENYVSWQYPETFRAIFEAIHDTAAVEPLLIDARRRSARVAIVTGKATALNEDHATVDIQRDPFLRVCHLAGRPVQNICRKDQQALYFALRHSQHLVDLITEDDIIDGNILRKYDVVYFSGEWIHNKAVPKVEQWVHGGGILFASTGLGHRNQYDESDSSLLGLLGVRVTGTEKNLYHVRPLLELPLAEPIDTIQLGESTVGGIAIKQTLAPLSSDVDVLGRWSNGAAAMTVRQLGKGKAYALGTAAGLSYLKTGLRPLPWARGGTVNLYNPVNFATPAQEMVFAAVEAAEIQRQVECSNPYVESLLLDNARGTLLTLINWTNETEIPSLDVSVRVKSQPKKVHSVASGRDLEFTFESGLLSFKTSLTDADFIMILNAP